jgi:hypothetical protein
MQPKPRGGLAAGQGEKEMLLCQPFNSLPQREIKDQYSGYVL